MEIVCVICSVLSWLCPNILINWQSVLVLILYIYNLRLMVCVDVSFCCTYLFWCGSWWRLPRHLETIAAGDESRMMQIHMICSRNCLQTLPFLRFDRCIYTSSANREKFSNQVRHRSCAPITYCLLTMKSTVSHLMIMIMPFLSSVIARLFREFHGWHHHC